MKAWQPILTPKTVLPLFFAIGIVFAPIGGALLFASAKVQEISIDYSLCTRDAPDCTADSSDMKSIPSDKVSTYFKNETESGEEPKWCKTTTQVPYPNASLNSLELGTPTCRLQWTLPDRLDAPVLLYYRLTNFFQNHRRYVRSFDQDQLKGNKRSVKDISGSDCDPLQIDEDTGKPYLPMRPHCEFRFQRHLQQPCPGSTPLDDGSSNTTYNMTSEGIAWSSDSCSVQGETDYKPE